MQLSFTNKRGNWPFTRTKQAFKQTWTSRCIKSFRVKANPYGENASYDPQSYITLGLAHCYERNEDGKLDDKFVIEPIGAPALECMANGAKTSFKAVTALKMSEAVEKDRELLPSQFKEGLYCEQFQERCEAASRTWQRPHAQDYLMDLVPIGTIRTNFNYNLDDKRVLNFENIVNDDDNIKQDMSIDVYGRQTDEDKEEGADASQNGAQASQLTGATSGGGDDIDALLDM